MLSYFRVISMAALVVVAVIAAISHPDPTRKVQTEQASLGGLWEPVLAETYQTAPIPTTTTTEPPAPPETAPQVRQVPAPVPQVAPRLGGLVNCTGFVIPDQIILRESGDNPFIWNTSGSGAFGCAQTLISHYNQGGTCSGDDPYTLDGQRDCVSRLSNGGTNLRPWGG